ncbi:MAG: SRPBCC family protein [Betaproteobacteria bacterium]|nr:SRPBCC family protein [Betaproteobacteria bacterium]
MEFENTLDVPLPPTEAWKLLLDIKRIAICIPGAELTEVVDDVTYKGKVAVSLGPVALSLVGRAKFEDIDHTNHKARVKAQGSDPKGRGSTASVIDFRIEPVATGSRIVINTDVKLSGAIAQYGRGTGIIQSLASNMIDQFGESLKAQLAQTQHASGLDPAEPIAVARPTKPIAGLTLIAKVIWDSIVRIFRRG